MHAEATPLVSVVIPTYNSARFIAQAVQAVLAQTSQCYEVIVVDDGSCDDTPEVLEAFAAQLRYCRQDHRGPAAARNAGVEIAKGEFVCFLDADDIWAPNKLEMQIEFMAAHDDIGLLFTDADEWEETGIQKRSIIATMICGADIVSQIPLQDAFRKLVIENFIPTSTVMIRKSAFVKAGCFDEELHSAEDRDLWLRVAAGTEIACLPMVLARKRSHGANISTRTEVTLRSRIKVWEKARCRFPTLATGTLYNRMLAGAYQDLGYILLAKSDGRAARHCAMTSLGHAAKYVTATKSRFPYRWSLSIGLLSLSFVPWPLVDALWQARNRILRGHGLKWPASARPRA